MWELDTQGWTQESDSGPSRVLSCTPSLCSQQLVGAIYIVPEKIAVVHSYQLLPGPVRHIMGYNLTILDCFCPCWPVGFLINWEHVRILASLASSSSTWPSSSVRMFRMWRRESENVLLSHAHLIASALSDTTTQIQIQKNTNTQIHSCTIPNCFSAARHYWSHYNL